MKDMTPTDYKMNHAVFSQGDSADAIYYIQKGKVQLTALSEESKGAVVGILGTDDFFGEGCLSGQPLRLTTATALTDCQIMRLEKAQMIRLLHDDPTFSELFLTYLLSRSIRLEKDLVDQLFNCSEKRLTRRLLLLVTRKRDPMNADQLKSKMDAVHRRTQTAVGADDVAMQLATDQRAYGLEWPGRNLCTASSREIAG